jgi:hypothetical protein
MSSGNVAAPSSRCAARDNTISCMSDSLVEVDLRLVELRVVSFVIFASGSLNRGTPPRHHRDPAAAHSQRGS